MALYKTNCPLIAFIRNSVGLSEDEHTVNRYPSGIISWSQEEINATDIKTKTLQKSYPEVL